MTQTNNLHDRAILTKGPNLDKRHLIPYSGPTLRKEIVFAIIAGSLLGLVIAFGVWRANIALKPKETEQTPTEETQSPDELAITIASPKNHTVSLEPTITIKGLTKASALIAISGEEEDYFGQADEKGEFEVEVDLVGGVNNLGIFAFDSEGNQTNQNLLVVYSSELAKKLQTETEDETDQSTEEAQIDDKVRQKVTEVARQPIAYLGTVTDINQESIQIKNNGSEIEQIATSEETDFAKTTGTSTDTASLEDVAIGDFLIAMGTTNGNGVLSASRIIITTSIKTTSRTIIYGQVKTIDEKEVSLSLTEGKEQTVTFGKSWQGPELSEVEEGSLILIGGTPDEETFAVRSLYLIPPETPEPTTSPTPEASPTPEVSPTPRG